ncbi:hypothetical protein EX30DRAFT_333433 [Ascodesmis nigricans]|uniref:Fms interacting protein n=1 Tax=Ascodesmis nigricans TaxID=341454 RepID=A0A4S2MQ26_9PEZI|nr:hypothetical protein EX30DRAFT_333433 [Ascodesmis nigricans]
MADSNALITDPLLLECLQVAERTRALCHELLTLVETNTPTDSTPLPDHIFQEKARKQKQLNTLTAHLKSLHRTVILQAREAKEAVTEKRKEVDRLHLLLQNLYYEQRHLRGEVKACRDFPHQYTALPLIPESEFLEQHPEHGESTPHELMIARLHNEKAMREDLERQRKELLAKKQALIAENKRRKDDLANLDEQLQMFIESAKPIQATFQKQY